PASGAFTSCAFEHLFMPLTAEAAARLWAGIEPRAADNLSVTARAGLRHSLLRQLTGLAAPAIYERFAEARPGRAPADAGLPPRHGPAYYQRFVADMRNGGLRRLFEDKPVLLRLIASLTRQWIDTSRELVLRLDADLDVIGRDILHSAAP